VEQALEGRRLTPSTGPPKAEGSTMAIFRFILNGGKIVDFPYDFEETKEKMLAVEMYLNMFWYEIKDMRILPGDASTNVYKMMNASLIDVAYPKEDIIEGLHRHDFIQKNLANEFGISERKLCYIIKQHGLRKYAEDMRKSLRDVKRQAESLVK
jgi:hypothetical protein